MKDPRSIYFNENIQEAQYSFSRKICNKVVRDKERLEEFGAKNRGSVSYLSEEEFLLSPQKMLLHIYEFLAIPYSHLSGLFLGKLERHFLKEYSWTKRQNVETIKTFDDSCSALYRASVYKALHDKSSLEWKQAKFPVTFSISY